MSPLPSAAQAPGPALAAATRTRSQESVRRRSRRGANSLLSEGTPMVWLTGGCLAISLAMIVGLLALVVYQGGATFWPVAVVRVETADGKVFMGEPARTEEYRPGAGASGAGALVHREMFRTGNFDLTGTHYTWVDDADVKGRTRPEWAVVFERSTWGRFFGIPKAFLMDGAPVAGTPEEAWAKFQQYRGPVRERLQRRRALEIDAVGEINRQIEGARLALRRIEIASGRDSPQWAQASAGAGAAEADLNARFEQVRTRIESLKAENARYALLVQTADGAEKALALADIVRAYPANRVTWADKVGVYLSRWWEFVSADPREFNTEGGVFPAIFGTATMTLGMSLAVVPIGVLAALYLREYARPGLLVSAVRIAVNNLAGVPSIVFGVFGLGFFCYVCGGTIDRVFFPARLPSPTFGTGGLLWASLTLALMTLPVVIVATEEALAAVPRSMRDGSYACGASKWQTIRRIVLPRAMPGIMTGMILAMARGAGEVAPLMLVGAAKLAPELPVDTVFPYVHPQRSFMHLGFHIYDLGFQSQDSEAAKPMVFTTTLLLIGLIGMLNIAAIALRTRLRRKFVASHF